METRYLDAPISISLISSISQEYDPWEQVKMQQVAEIEPDVLQFTNPQDPVFFTNPQDTVFFTNPQDLYLDPVFFTQPIEMYQLYQPRVETSVPISVPNIFSLSSTSAIVTVAADVKTFYESTAELRLLAKDLSKELSNPKQAVVQTSVLIGKIGKELMKSTASALAQIPGLVNQVAAVMLHPDLWNRTDKIKYIQNYLMQLYPDTPIRYVKKILYQSWAASMRAIYGKWSVAQSGALVVFAMLRMINIIGNWGLFIGILQTMGIWNLPSILVDLLVTSLTEVGMNISKTLLTILPTVWDSPEPEVMRVRRAVEQIKFPEQSVRRIMNAATNLNTLTNLYGIASATSAVVGFIGVSGFAGSVALSGAAVGGIWVGIRGVQAIPFRKLVTGVPLDPIQDTPANRQREFASLAEQIVTEQQTIAQDVGAIQQQAIKNVDMSDAKSAKVKIEIEMENKMDSYWKSRDAQQEVVQNIDEKQVTMIESLPLHTDQFQFPHNQEQMATRVVESAQSVIMRDVFEHGTLLYPVQNEKVEQAQASAQTLSALSNDFISNLSETLSLDFNATRAVALDWITKMAPYAGSYAAGGMRSLLVQLLIQSGLQRIPALSKTAETLPKEAEEMISKNEHTQLTPKWQIFTRRVLRGMQGGDYLTFSEWKDMSNIVLVNYVNQAQLNIGTIERGRVTERDLNKLSPKSMDQVKRSLFLQQHTMYLQKRQEMLTSISSALASNLLSQWIVPQVVPDVPDAPDEKEEVGIRPRTPPPTLITTTEEKQILKQEVSNALEFTSANQRLSFLPPEYVSSVRDALVKAIDQGNVRQYEEIKTEWTRQLTTQVNTWRKWITELDVEPNRLQHNQLMQELDSLKNAIELGPFREDALNKMGYLQQFVLPTYMGQKIMAIQNVIDQIPLSMRNAVSNGKILVRMQEFSQRFTNPDNIVTADNIAWLNQFQSELTQASVVWWSSLNSALSSESELVQEWKRLGLSWRLVGLQTDFSAHDLSSMGLANVFAYLASTQVKLEQQVAQAKPILEKQMSIYAQLAEPRTRMANPKTLSYPTGTWDEYAKTVIPDDTELKGTKKMAPFLYSPFGEFLWSLGLKSGARLLDREFSVPASTGEALWETMKLSDLSAYISFDPLKYVPWLAAIRTGGRVAEGAQTARVMAMLVNRGLDNLSGLLPGFAREEKTMLQSANKYLFPSDAGSIRASMDQLDALTKVNQVVQGINLSTLLARATGEVSNRLRDTGRVEFDPGQKLTELSREALIKGWSKETFTLKLIDAFVGGSQLAQDVQGALENVGKVAVNN